MRFFITFVVILFPILAQSFAEQLASDGLEKAKGFAASESSGAYVPGYSKESAAREASSFGGMDDADLKQKSHNVGMSKEGAIGIINDSADEIDGMESHRMFEVADKIWEDPMSAMEGACVERYNDQQNQYRKEKYTEIVREEELYEKTCQKPKGDIVCESNLSVSCVDSVDCGHDSGGIERGQVESDMRFVYSYPYLTIGTIADNYWRGNCRIYDRKTTFKVKYVQGIKEFKIVRLGYDDYMQIKINGHQVFNGPKGGNKLDVVDGFFGFWRTKLVSTGVGEYSCELDMDHSYSGEIDLKPYLKEGENIIQMRVIVAGKGEGWMRFKVSEYCCKSFEDRWEERCWQE